ncbi:MAG: hypothetical protein AB7N65_14170 [Vicinamibacterales bacterium]
MSRLNRCIVTVLMGATLALGALHCNAGDRPTAGARPVTTSLARPDGERVIIDFTNTALPVIARAAYVSGPAIVADMGFPHASCVVTKTNDGLRIENPAALAASGYCSAAYVFGSQQTLSNTEYIEVDAEWPDHGKDYNSLQLWVVNDNGVAANSYTGGYNSQTSSVYQSQPKSPYRQAHVYRFGGHAAAWNAGSGGAAGFPNNVKLYRVEVRVVAHASVAGSPSAVVLKSIRVSKRNLPFVMFSFDDCKRSQLIGDGGTLQGAAEILSTRGIKATIYCSSNYVGNANNLTVADIATLKNTYGWDVQIQQTEGGTGDNAFPGLPFLTAGTGGMTRSGNTCTFVGNVTVPSRLKTGDYTTIWGAHNPLYNGTVQITEGGNNYTWTWDCSAAGTAGAASPASGAVHAYRGGGWGTEAQFKQVLRNEIAYFTERGFDNLIHLGYTTGMSNEFMARWAYEVGFRTGRGFSHPGAAPLSKTFNPQGGSPTTLMSFPYCGSDNVTFAGGTQPCVDTAVNYGTSVAIVGHDITDCSGASGSATATCDAELAVLADYVKQKRDLGLLRSGTVSEFYDRARQ